MKTTGGEHPYTLRAGEWESRAEGVTQETARIGSSQELGEEPGMYLDWEGTSSGHDVGTSSFLNSLGGHLPGQEEGWNGAASCWRWARGEGLGQGAWLAFVFPSSGLLTPSQSGLSRCSDSPRDAGWHGEGSAGLWES